MKRIIAPTTLVIAFVIVFVLGIAPGAQAVECSNATLKGTFADKDTGVITSPPSVAGPFAGINLETFDGNGTLKGSGINSLNGNMVAVTETGTYTVNADCTGTYTVQISPLGLTTNAFFVIDDSGNELQVIVMNPGTVITCIARRQFQGDRWEW